MYSTFLLVLLQLCGFLLMVGKPYPVLVRHDEEKYFEDSKTKIKCPFPSLTDMPTVSLSVIVPAYNEERRRMFFFLYCCNRLEEMKHTKCD